MSTGLPEQVRLTSIENVFDIEVRNGPDALGIESHPLDEDYQCVGSTCLVHSAGSDWIDSSAQYSFLLTPIGCLDKRTLAAR